MKPTPLPRPTSARRRGDRSRARAGDGSAPGGTVGGARASARSKKRSSGPATATRATALASAWSRSSCQSFRSGSRASAASQCSTAAAYCSRWKQARAISAWLDPPGSSCTAAWRAAHRPAMVADLDQSGRPLPGGAPRGLRHALHVTLGESPSRHASLRQRSRGTRRPARASRGTRPVATAVTAPVPPRRGSHAMRPSPPAVTASVPLRERQSCHARRQPLSRHPSRCATAVMPRPSEGVAAPSRPSQLPPSQRLSRHPSAARAAVMPCPSPAAVTASVPLRERQSCHARRQRLSRYPSCQPRLAVTARVPSHIAAAGNRIGTGQRRPRARPGRRRRSSSGEPARRGRPESPPGASAPVMPGLVRDTIG